MEIGARFHSGASAVPSFIHVVPVGMAPSDEPTAAPLSPRSFRLKSTRIAQETVDELPLWIRRGTWLHITHPTFVKVSSIVFVIALYITLSETHLLPRLVAAFLSGTFLAAIVLFHFLFQKLCRLRLYQGLLGYCTDTAAVAAAIQTYDGEARLHILNGGGPLVVSVLLAVFAVPAAVDGRGLMGRALLYGAVTVLGVLWVIHHVFTFWGVLTLQVRTKIGVPWP
jgi:hypothetical protein